MDKITGSKISFMDNYPELGRIDSMDIFAEDSIDGINAINFFSSKLVAGFTWIAIIVFYVFSLVSTSCSNKNGFCSTFCFPTPSGRTCGCQDNVSLQSDQLTCQGGKKIKHWKWDNVLLKKQPCILNNSVQNIEISK